MKKVQLMLVGLLALSLFGVAAWGDGQVTINGSTTVGPIAQEIQNWFLVNNSAINVVVSATGSGDGIAALINGEADIAMHSRQMKTSEFGRAVESGVFPVIYTIARDKIAVAVHESNPIDDISLDELYELAEQAEQAEAASAEPEPWTQQAPEAPPAAPTRR